MKRLDRETIKTELEKPNGSTLLANDPKIDKAALLDETAALYIEEGIGSSLLVRMLKSRMYPGDTPCREGVSALRFAQAPPKFRTASCKALP